ncbi:MAG: flagellar basal body P-ring formation protein FlgA [Opitutaceae bacterium]|nr:flagellar basal body P-ring formation protein FlgA [Opitutaceae bacterium]
MSTFTRTRLSLILAAAAAASLASPAWLRAETVPAAAQENAGKTFTREQVVAGLTRALVSHFNLEGDLQLELLRPWTAPTRTALVWDLDIIEFPQVATSSMMLRARILADGVQHAEVNFIIRAQLWRDAWAARQPVAVGAAFDAAALEARRVDLFRDREALPASVGDRSYVYARAVSAGRMLTWRDVARRPLVRKGDLIEVTATDGPLLVTMKALAMENGAQGDTITVRNPESRKNFSALVVDESRVQVRF